MTRFRSRIVGTASWAAARKSLKNGPSRSATGFEASTRGSRSSSVARRLTKVVFAWRMKSGSREIASFSAVDWLPIAPIIRSTSWIRSDMSGARAASAPERCEVSTINDSKACWSTVSSSNSRREVERKGFR